MYLSTLFLTVLLAFSPHKATSKHGITYLSHNNSHNTKMGFYVNNNSIFLSIYFEKRYRIPVGITITSKDHFNKDTKRLNLVRGKYLKNEKHNDKLDIIDKRLKEAKNIEEVRDIIDNPQLITYLTFFQRVIQDSQSESYRKALNRAYNMIGRYNLEAVKKLENFGDLNYEFLKEFEAWCATKTYSVNYAAKTLKCFVYVHNQAVRFDHCKPLKERLYIKGFDKAHVVLSDGEVEKIGAVEGLTPMEEKARYLFFVQCHTGLRYSDAVRVIHDDLIHGEFIEIIQKKTKQRVVVPVMDELREFVELKDKYEEFHLSLVKHNLALKEVCRKAGIDQPVIQQKKIGGKVIENTKPKFDLVTSHTGRRSFATNYYQKGVPAPLLMKITGHKSESSFMKYINISEKQAAQRFKEFINKRK